MVGLGALSPWFSSVRCDAVFDGATGLSTPVYAIDHQRRGLGDWPGLSGGVWIDRGLGETAVLFIILTFSR